MNFLKQKIIAAVGATPVVVWVFSLMGACPYHTASVPVSQSSFKQILKTPVATNPTVATSDDNLVWFSGYDEVGKTPYLLFSQNEGVTFRKIEGRPGPKLNVTALAGNPGGGVWSGTLQSGLWTLPPHSSKFACVQYPVLKSAGILSLNVWNANVVWVVTAHNGFFRVTQNNVFTRVNYLDGDIWQICGLAFNDTGTVWVASKNTGLLKLTPDEKNLALVNPHMEGWSVTCLKYTADKTLWVGTANHGLWKSVDEGQNFVLVAQIPDITSLNTDAANLWVGTKTNGLWRVNTQASVAKQVGLARSTDWKILKVTSDYAGAVWVQTAKNGLWRKNLPYQTEFVDPNGGVVREIKGSLTVVSDREITLLVFPSQTQSITINGFVYNIGNKKFSYRFLPSKAPNNVLITLRTGTVLRLKIWVKTTINDNDVFSTLSGYKLIKYTGFVNGNYKNAVQVVCVLGNMGRPLLTVSLLDKPFVPYEKCFWQSLVHWKPNGLENHLTSSVYSIRKQGLSVLFLQDIVGNKSKFFVQVGGNKVLIPQKPNAISLTHATWETKKRPFYKTWTVLIVGVVFLISGVVITKTLLQLRKKHIKIAC